MTFPRRIAALTAVGLIALTLVSCGGGNNNDPTPGPDRQNGDGNGENGGGAAEKAREAARNFRDSRFRANYNFTSAPDDDFPGGTMVLHKDGTDRFRFEIKSTIEGEEVEVIFIDAGDTSGFCLKNAGELGAIFGVPDGEGICFEDDPTGGSGIGDISKEFEQLGEDSIDATDVSERQIAGQDGTCFKSKDDDGSVSDVCVSDDGVLLYARSDDGSVLEATEVSDQVDADVFTLPYEVRDLPGAPDSGE